MLGIYARRIDKALQFVKTLVGDDAVITAAVEAGKSKFSGFELSGRTLGVIGLGKIGVLVANAGIQHGMKVVGYDAFPTLSNMHQLNSRVEVWATQDVQQDDESVIDMKVHRQPPKGGVPAITP